MKFCDIGMASAFINAEAIFGRRKVSSRRLLQQPHRLRHPV